MKKILYLAVLAIALQSCLKDKENESDIFNGVNKNQNIISFARPNRLTEANVLDTKVAALPKFVLEDVNTVQTYEVAVEILTKVLDKDLVVTLKSDLPKIAQYNAKRIADYYAAKAKYDQERANYNTDLAAYIAAGGPGQTRISLPVPPKVIPLYIDFKPLPVGKFTFPSSVTILKGTRSAKVTLSIADASEPTGDYKQGEKYMMPLTLQSDTDILLANPTLLLSVLRKSPNPYPGAFAYTGFSDVERADGSAIDRTTITGSIHDFTLPEESDNPSLGCEDCVEAPVSLPFVDAVYIQLNFTGATATTLATSVTVSRPWGGSLRAGPLPTPVTLGSPPTLVDGNVPTLEFITVNGNPKLNAIRGIKYTYRNTNNRLRTFEVDMVRVP